MATQCDTPKFLRSDYIFLVDFVEWNPNPFVVFAKYPQHLDSTLKNQFNRTFAHY